MEDGSHSSIRLALASNSSEHQLSGPMYKKRSNCSWQIRRYKALYFK